MKLFELYEDDDFIYLVLEYMTGGKLFDRIVDKEHYSEKEAADTIRPVIDAIKYCHSLGIVHRDLKVSFLTEGSLKISFMPATIPTPLSKSPTSASLASSTRVRT